METAKLSVVKKCKEWHELSVDGAKRFNLTFEPIENSIKIKKTKSGFEVRYLTSFGDCQESPRDWDNVGTMLCFHRNYRLGDKTELKEDGFSGWQEIAEYLKTELKAEIIFPLYLYDHSGISMSIGREYPYNDRWDAGQVGYIYVTAEKIKKEGLTRKKAEQCLKNEVETYNCYLTGDVYTIVKEKFDKKYNSIDFDSCCGYYGYKSALESLETEI